MKHTASQITYFELQSNTVFENYKKSHFVEAGKASLELIFVMD